MNDYSSFHLLLLLQQSQKDCPLPQNWQRGKIPVPVWRRGKIPVHASLAAASVWCSLTIRVSDLDLGACILTGRNAYVRTCLFLFSLLTWAMIEGSPMTFLKSVLILKSTLALNSLSFFEPNQLEPKWFVIISKHHIYFPRSLSLILSQISSMSCLWHSRH